MSKPPTVVWCGYEFQSYIAKDTLWKDLPGIYIFAGVSEEGRWSRAKYIGQTTSFEQRLGQGNTNHECWQEAIKLGATHVHARLVENELARISIESNLIDVYKPPLNS